ncbi:hypothetical protein DEI93_14730 [Curtobacterium sp. MCBD17_035]|uniref:hypothetical protein n=1 Tax=Curtobacterium sp. MCBD17_035 TaxID=2175673 RepID=UPI0011B50ADF|nr:hypothetical protein [Curtobacterium sp. MCBD17_035]WIB67191.1 hypothetical protein DEI93_14730 [Curtobacterium sp. MCBD17_035]
MSERNSPLPAPGTPLPPPRYLAHRPLVMLWSTTLALVVTAVVFWVRAHLDFTGSAYHQVDATAGFVMLGVGVAFVGLAVLTATVSLVLHALGHRLVVPNPDAADPRP